MAETGTQNITEVTEASSIATGDNIYLNHSNQLQQIDYDKLATAILNKLSTQSFSSLETTAKTVLGGINELNSKSIMNITTVKTLVDKAKKSIDCVVNVSAHSQLINEITNSKYTISGKGFVKSDGANNDFMFVLGEGRCIIAGRINNNYDVTNLYQVTMEQIQI